ncbi:Glycerol-3-phosphate/dihydroxyacetone phosphate acyltransferase [Massospora cicadina]|nr:Glycerol-3-phosphate/dihydroxyacetone phosphate acyltransferase [Massospora cicadina]
MVERADIFYDAWSWFLNAVVDVFFREVQTRGLHKTPDTGPIFFVAAPHCNQFFDPIVLNRHCHRRILYLCAKKSYDRPIVGLLARGLRSIPVARAQDYAFEGEGRLKVIDRYRHPTTITGVGTRFTHQLKPGMVIALPRGTGGAEVSEIRSDTELLVKREIKSLPAMEQLSREGGVAFKCVPYFDQSKVYKEVHDILNKGECVGIFPEGGSHDRSELLPLKAGIAVMALGAMAENPELDVKIVPVGMNYFHPDRFRSRAVVDYGSPFAIPRELVRQFAEGGESKRAACGKLLGMVSDALKSVTVTTPDYETLMVIQAARRLYQSPYRKANLSRAVKFNRLLVAGYLHFKDEPRVVGLRERVFEYNAKLRDLGIYDHQVKTTVIGKREALMKLLRRLAFAAAYGVLTLPALTLNFPIIASAEIVSRRKRAEALASSQVKISARDVVSSWKLMIALGVGPATYLFYAAVAGILAFKAGVAGWFLVPPLTFFLIPTLSYYCLIFGDRCYDNYRSLRPLLLTLLGGPNVRDLAAEREDLSGKITALIRELGPQLYPDFELEERNAFRTSPPPHPSPPTPNLIGEKLYEFSSSPNLSQFNSRSASFSDLANLLPFTKLDPAPNQKVNGPRVSADPPSTKKSD